METTTPTVSAALSIKDALGLLDQLSSDRAYSCWVPSLQKDVFFKEVTAGQQKEFLKAIVDSPFYKSKFIITVYEILKRNLIDVQLNDLTIIDKQLLLLKMRIECFDSKYEITTDNPKADKLVDLNYVYDQAKQNIKLVEPDNIRDGPITLDVATPSIETEYKLEKELHENIDVMAVNDAIALRTVLGDMFISEISKFVTSIDIGGKSINLKPLMFRSRIEILEKLPNTTVRGVISYIDKVKNVIDSITTVELPVKDSDETVKETFPIDGTFFVAAPTA